MIEHSWQFLKRYDGKPVADVLHTAEYSENTEVVGSPTDGYYLQYFRKTGSLFNGAPIWQDMTDQTHFVVRANVPVTVQVGKIEVVNDVLVKYLITLPDPLGTEIQPIWKMTAAANIGSILDGYQATDLFRGYDLPLRHTPDFLLGALAGGNAPVPGLYFRDLVVAPSGDDITLVQKVYLAPIAECEATHPGALALPVTSLTDLMDLTAKAMDACAAEGKTMSSMIINYMDSSDGFTAEAYTCCE